MACRIAGTTRGHPVIDAHFQGCEAFADVQAIARIDAQCHGVGGTQLDKARLHQFRQRGAQGAQFVAAENAVARHQ